MFICPNLVFLELQKTGGSHIRRLLALYADGREHGKHNRPSEEDLKSRYVVGSIRNPWDWYVSLWAYGVGGKGALRYRTSRNFDLDFYHRVLPHTMGKNWLTPVQFLVAAYHDVKKPVDEWQRAYANSEDAALFRAWLRLVLATDRRFDIGEGYGFSPISRHAGLLTYRYFRLFSLGDSVYRDGRLRSIDGLTEYDRENNIANGMIRMESLEDDFIRVLKEAGCSLSDEQINDIRHPPGGKTNTSRRRTADYYYDAETAALVAEKDRYLISKYGYVAPVISSV